MECVICLESTSNSTKVFNCDHINYHLNCIKNVIVCPLCKVCKIANDNIINGRFISRILVWHYNQILPASIYRSAKKLDCEIVIIKSLSERGPNDLIYHYP